MIMISGFFMRGQIRWYYRSLVFSPEKKIKPAIPRKVFDSLTPPLVKTIRKESVDL